MQNKREEKYSKNEQIEHQIKELNRLARIYTRVKNEIQNKQLPPFYTEHVNKEAKTQLPARIRDAYSHIDQSIAILKNIIASLEKQVHLKQQMQFADKVKKRNLQFKLELETEEYIKWRAKIEKTNKATYVLPFVANYYLQDQLNDELEHFVKTLQHNERLQGFYTNYYEAFQRYFKKVITNLYFSEETSSTYIQATNKFYNEQMDIVSKLIIQVMTLKKDYEQHKAQAKKSVSAIKSKSIAAIQDSLKKYLDQDFEIPRLLIAMNDSVDTIMAEVPNAWFGESVFRTHLKKLKQTLVQLEGLYDSGIKHHIEAIEHVDLDILLDPDFSHKHMIDLQDALGYITSPYKKTKDDEKSVDGLQGVCNGFTSAVRDAALCGEFDAVVKRIGFFATHSAESMVKQAEDAKLHFKNREENFYSPIHSIKHYQKFDYKTPNSGSEQTDDRTLQSMAFFDAMQLYQRSYLNGDIFNKDVGQCDWKSVYPLVASEKSKASGGIIQIFDSLTILSQSELQEYLQVITDRISNYKPASNIFIIMGGDYLRARHAVGLFFNKENKSWTLVDANQIKKMVESFDAKNVPKVIAETFKDKEVRNQMLLKNLGNIFGLAITMRSLGNLKPRGVGGHLFEAMIDKKYFSNIEISIFMNGNDAKVQQDNKDEKHETLENILQREEKIQFYNTITLEMVNRKSLRNVDLAFIAASANRVDILEKIGKLDIKLLQKEGKNSPIYAAVDFNCIDAFKFLLAQDKTLLKDFDLFLKVIIQDKEDLLDILLKDKERDVNMEDNNGLFPLACAVYTDNKKLLNKLLDSKQVNPFYESKKFPGMTAAHAAAELNKVNALNVMAAYGIDIMKVNSRGESPLVNAKKEKKKEAEALLMDYEKFVNLSARVRSLPDSKEDQDKILAMKKTLLDINANKELTIPQRLSKLEAAFDDYNKKYEIAISMKR